MSRVPPASHRDRPRSELRLPQLPTERSNPIERFVGDLARKGFESALWHGMTVAVDALAPGAGRAIQAVRFTTRLLDAAESVVAGRGFAVKVPALVSPETGFSLDVRVTVGQTREIHRLPVGIEAGFDPFQPARPGELSVEGAPAVRTIETGPEHLRCVGVTARGVDLAALVGTSRIDAAALRRYVELSPQADLAPHQPRDPWVIAYSDPDTGIGLVAVVPPEGEPYCPLLVEARPATSTRLWTTDGSDIGRLLADIPAEPARPLTVRTVHRRVRRAPQPTRTAAERRFIRRRPRREAVREQEATVEPWTLAYEALRTRYEVDFHVEPGASIDEWRQAVDREHRFEVALIVDDIVRLNGGTRELSGYVDAVGRARRFGNFFDYAPGLVGYVLIGLAEDARSPSLASALLEAAGLEVVPGLTGSGPAAMTGPQRSTNV